MQGLPRSQGDDGSGLWPAREGAVNGDYVVVDVMGRTEQMEEGRRRLAAEIAYLTAFLTDRFKEL
jgi:hypothetical protein